MNHQAILLPGGVLPPDLAYGGLIDAFDDRVSARPKALEVYAGPEPPAGYGLETEVDGVLGEADAAGFERFHLVGYSAGGAISAAVVARAPERVISLALLEPAWVGNRGLGPGERAAKARMERIRGLPGGEMMREFVRLQIAPGVEPPPSPDGPAPPWMARRPAGLTAITEAFDRFDLDPEALRAFTRPVYYALGGRSNPEYYGEMAERLEGLFADFTLEVYPDRHHFDPPHRVEPERLAGRLSALWDRAVTGVAA
ncbi:MAG TPA: alpha/beta fold hydrolase [Solirubrobacterales bacterium]|nr:alpha/beta fold hydrolase [Solirubrobacterales bacterium]